MGGRRLCCVSVMCLLLPSVLRESVTMVIGVVKVVRHVWRFIALFSESTLLIVSKGPSQS